VFVHGSTGSEPTQNTQSELTDSGEKWEGAKMKITLDNHAISKMCNEWMQIVEVSTEPVYIDGEASNTVLDDCDLAYIKEIMEENPKLERLMPYIIKEVIIQFEEF